MQYAESWKVCTTRHENTATNNSIYTIEWQEINHQRGKDGSRRSTIIPAGYAVQSWLRHGALNSNFNATLLARPCWTPSHAPFALLVELR